MISARKVLIELNKLKCALMSHNVCRLLSRRLIDATILFTLSAQAGTNGEISADFSRTGDSAHLELRGRTQWNIKVRREGDTISFDLPALPEATIGALQSANVPFVESVKVSTGPNAGHTVTIRLTGSEIESFDYLTDQPPRFIIDIFKKEPKKELIVAAPTPAVVQRSNTTVGPAPESPNKESASIPTSLPAKKKVATKSARKPASTEHIRVEAAAQGEKKENPLKTKTGVYDGGNPDFSRFTIHRSDIREEAILASRQNIYLPFPMLETDEHLIEQLWANPPKYEIAEDQTEENKQARLLLTLFTNNRHSVYLKTLKDFFEKDFPNSKYDELVRYMEADIYYEKWRKDKDPSDLDNALTRYRTLAERYSESPLAERTSLLVAYSYFERSDYFNALKAFQRFLNSNPKSKFANHVKLSMAKTLTRLRNFPEAIKTLDGVENDPTAGSYAVTAAVQKGDTHFAKKDFETAIEEYKRAAKKYTAAETGYPGLTWNIAEGQFWLGRYEESLNTFVDFFKKFPKDSHCSYAITRIGELLELLGADATKVNGAFLESIYRFHDTDGAGIAKIRLTSRRMPELKEKEIEEATREIETYTAKSKLPRIEEFKTLLQAEGYFRRQDYEKSLDLLINYYQSHPTQDLSVFKERIVNNIARLIGRESEAGRFFEAFKIYGKYASVWLASANRIDVAYYLGKSYERAGVPEEAEQYYRRALNRLYSVRGTNTEKEVRIHQVLPTEDALNLRLAANYLNLRKFANAERHLTSIQNPDGLALGEQIERAEVATALAMERKDFKRARAHLEDLLGHWRGQPAQISSPLLKLARLGLDTGEYDSALLNVEKIISLSTDTNEVPVDLVAQALEVRAEVLIKQKKVEGAIQALEELLEKHESKKPMESIRYKLGTLYFSKGDLASAEKAWSGLKQESVWSRLAQEQIESAKWQDQYKKYIRRAPASSGGEKK